MGFSFGVHSSGHRRSTLLPDRSKLCMSHWSNQWLTSKIELMVFPHSSTVLSRRTVRTWHGWHHHMALSLMAVWFLIGETHRGQQWTPALTLPQVRYGLSVLLLEVFCTPGVDYICRQVQLQLLRNEAARFYHHRTRKCIPPRKLRRDIQ